MKEPIENWRQIPGYADYEVSDQGRVRSWKKYGLISPRILKEFDDDGYTRVQLSHESRRVHQLVLEAFTGPRPDGMLTRHLDGNRGNNTLPNLTYGTPSQNMYDRVAHGNDSNSNKTHCPDGHEYTTENTLILRRSKNAASGRPEYRACRICRNRIKRESWRRQKARLIEAVDGAA